MTVKELKGKMENMPNDYEVKILEDNENQDIEYVLKEDSYKMVLLAPEKTIG